MKYVIIALSEASKLDFSGADKLAKTDHIICLYVKGKKNITAAVQEEFDALKAEIEFDDVVDTQDLWMYAAYLMGYHVAAKHSVFVVTKDKDKLPSKITSEAKVYTSFKSVTSDTGSSTKKSTTKKSTTKKSTTASKKSTAKKSASTKKTTSKKKDTDVIDVIGSLVSGDKKKAKEGLVDIAGQLLGGK